MSAVVLAYLCFMGVAMAINFVTSQSKSIGGIQFNGSKTLSASGGLTRQVSLAAAKVGQLTTRTSTTVGTLTMASGHGITNAARLDIYWAGGCRYGVTVGTVSSLSVPFSLGSGDSLPANLTAITAMVPQKEEFSILGDNIVGIAASSDVQSAFAFVESDSTTACGAFTLDYAGLADGWDTSSNYTNPLAGKTVAYVYLSHADSSGTKTVQVGAAFD